MQGSTFMRGNMVTLKASGIIILLLLYTITASAQTEKTLDSIANKHQFCLDSGVDMLGCSKRFFIQMDSMINVVYTQLRSISNPAERKDIKNKQKSWLKKRNIYFLKQDKIFQDKIKKGEWGQDMAMIIYDDKAEFVKERIIVLMSMMRRK